MELPGDRTNTNYEYYAHDRLPSNSTLRNYALCFDKSKYCALWIAYPLHQAYQGSAERKDNFGYDPDIQQSWQANIGRNAYYPQGGTTFSHSRGHQVPSEDRTASQDDNTTTFYASNMTPQLQNLNGGQWSQLETKVRNWICSDTLYVVTGSYFDPARVPNYAYDDKGEGKACPVPTHYYKVVIRSKTGSTGRKLSTLAASELQCIGFWFDHENPSSWNIASSVCSVAEIESLTGFQFFVNVPNAPKDQKNTGLWPGL